MHSLEQTILESRDWQRASVVIPYSQTALVLSGKNPSAEDYKLRELLDFFGILWKAVSAEEITAERLCSNGGKYCILSSAPDVAQALKATLEADGALPRWMIEASSVYICGFEGTDLCKNLLRFLTGDAQATIRNLNKPDAFIFITSNVAEMCGPMSGMRVAVDLTEDHLLFGVTPKNDRFESIITTSDGQVFVRVVCQGVPFYLNVTSKTIDINSPSEKHFDVKKHFRSAVPITMYLKWAFHDASWRSPEINACLIVDDPPLKPRYGFLRFREISQLMDRKNFTTAIAFIPWNWRRTNRHTVNLFRSRPDRLSVAVHGCDHTASEFATRSGGFLDRRVRAARQRMDSFVQRTSLPYDRIMVFPQGVFSPETGRALKSNGFVAAVNTEVAPWQNDGNETKIRDVWDVAIMKYGTFAIFTRRYLNDGIENFAFDALLGKPCLIAAHHDVFKGHGRDLAEFVARLNSLNCNLFWRPLGEAINRSFTVRARADERIIIRMFAESLVIENPTPKPREAVFMKEENDPGSVKAVTVNQNAIDFNCNDGYLRFSVRLFPKQTTQVRVAYFETQDVSADWQNGGIRYNVKTGLRRYLSEFRDNYVSQSDFLYKNAIRIKKALTG